MKSIIIFALLDIEITLELGSCPDKSLLGNKIKQTFFRCNYCDVPYQVILKAENFAEDQKYIGLLANITFPKIGEFINLCDS